MVLALAATEANYGWSPEKVRMEARREGGGHVLSGTKLFVHDAMFAADLLVLARTGAGLSLLRVDARAAGVAVRPLAGFLSGIAEVTFDKVQVPVPVHPFDHPVNVESGESGLGVAVRVTEVP